MLFPNKQINVKIKTKNICIISKLTLQITNMRKLTNIKLQINYSKLKRDYVQSIYKKW